ncbi:MAG TPA: hypothetical protein VNJ71_08815, partial [Gemmatimonadales bacterium]|nr:hypothetical protein [Gemmatimonadales bacterium]
QGGGAISSVVLPLAAGVLAAAHPAGARGLAGLTSAVQLQALNRERQREEEERQALLGFGRRFSELLGQEAVPAQPAQLTEALSPGEDPEAAAFLGRQPAQPALRLSDVLGLGPEQTELYRQMLAVPQFIPGAASALLQRMAPQEFTLGEGQRRFVRTPRGEVREIAAGPAKAERAIAASPGQAIIDPTTGRILGRVPDRPMALQPGQWIVQDGQVIGQVPDRPITLSPGQAVVDPSTRRELFRAPDKPVVLSPGQALVSGESGDVITTRPDRPVAVAPGGALVRPETGQTILERPPERRGIVVEETGPGGQPRQALVDPATGQPIATFGPKPQPTRPSDISTMRQQFLGRAQQLGVHDVQSAFAAIERISGAPPSPFGDMALLYSYIKLLDPNSAVREGEYATADQARSVPQQIVSMYNRAVAGELLLPERRRDILEQTRRLAAARVEALEQAEAEFRRIAEAQGFDPAMVVPDLLGPARQRIKTEPRTTLRAPRRADVDQALREARGDRQRALQILRQRGFDPDAQVQD